jgi:hypothetical protein
MRLSEKTIELTFCHQFGSITNHRLIWFGLTQAQESIAGFDACTRVGGTLLIFQFKASSYTLRNGRRRFHAPHEQMVHLRARCGATRGLYYVFPLTGTTQEITANPNLLSSCWFLDVADLPNPLPPPTTKLGTVRRNALHYIDVEPCNAVIHSEPFTVPLIDTSKIASTITMGSQKRTGLSLRKIDDLLELRATLKRKAVAVIIQPQT